MKGSLKVYIGGFLVLMLLGGYTYTNRSGTAAQPADGVETQTSTSAANGQTDVQNRKELQLVVLFQALLQMDRKEGLSISKELAAGLLPLIRKSRDQGELTADEQKQALDLLSPDQQKFYEEMAAQMKNRVNGGIRKKTADLTQEQRDKLIEQFKSRKDSSSTDPSSTINHGEGEGSSGKSLGTSMEQQLIDLLESKAKP